jgi:drug/metabolite transporter (DMT)-like permease
MLSYTSSLWTIPLATLVLGERSTATRVGGVAAGCLGIALLLEPWSLDWSDGGTLGGIGLLLLSAISIAVTTVHVRAHRWRRSPLELLPWQFGAAAVALGAVAVAAEGAPRIDWTPALWASLAYQAGMASTLGEWGSLTVTRSLSAISANIALMMTPVVGLASSIVVTNEPLTVGVAVGGTLIIAGVAVGLVFDPARQPFSSTVMKRSTVSPTFSRSWMSGSVEDGRR